MKYLHLIWAALFRRKTRTFLTLVSIVAAFLLFGMLDAVRTGFDQAGNSANGAERLQTGSRLSFIQTLPQSLEARIAQVPGVKMVTYANWFGGAYQDPHNQVFSFAVEPNYLDLYPEMEVSPAERKAFEALSLEVSATAAQVKTRYKDLVKRHHPDANGGYRSTEDRLIEIIQAYNYLKSVGMG